MAKLTFRPWSEFLELNSFKVPAQQDYVDRVQVNLVYYQANYLGLVLLHLLLVCFWRPVFLLGLTSVVGSAIYLFSVRKAPIRLTDGKVLTKREVMLAYGVLSFLVCVMFGGSASVLGLSVATLAVLVHSSFRQRSLKSKVNVGLISMLSGARHKSEDGPDDDDHGGVDEENPPRDGPRLPGADTADLSASRNEQLLKEQQQFRSAFRAQMRAKYLKKG